MSRNKTEPPFNVAVVRKNEREEGYNLKIEYELENPSFSQKKIARLMRETFILAIQGQTGVGKTLAVAIESLKMIKSRETRKLVFVRPQKALNADGHDSIRTFRSYLDVISGKETIDLLIEKGKIQSETFAALNTVTPKNSLIIIDQAQFATKYELYTALTRAGKGSRVIILADLDAISPDKDIRSNGYQDLIRRYHESSTELGAKEFTLLEFEKDEIQRNPALPKLLKLYSN